MLYVNVTLRLSYIVVQAYDNSGAIYTYILQSSFYLCINFFHQSIILLDYSYKGPVR